MCIKEVEPLGWHRLQPAQVTRSVRLLSILKTCFGNHPRASLVVQHYEESKSFHRRCGFECLRLIAREFSVKTRTELLFFRTRLANSTITAPTIPEIIRKIQSELFQYERVSQLVDPSVNIKGLEFVEADKVLVLLRALPQQCRQWVVLNSPDESFQTYIDVALRYEAQQRIWLDMNGKPIASLGGFEPKGGKGGKGGKDLGKKGKKGDKGDKGKGSRDRADKGKGIGTETRTCFHCNERGHLAADCPKRPKNDRPPKGDGKNTKGKKGDKGGKNNPKGGKPQGKRATEFASYQPESEAGSEPWSEPDVEDGGRLSVCLAPQVPKNPCLPCGPFFICQSTTEHDPYLWLVDSGASRTVVSAEALNAYRVLREREMPTPIQFRTASGEQVGISKECMLEVFFPTLIEYDDHEKAKLIRYEVRAVIGPVEHNLLSVHSLTRMGATFEFGPDDCLIRVSDIRRMQRTIWASVPWVRAHCRKHRTKHEDVDMEHAHMFEVWSESSPSNQGSQSPMSRNKRHRRHRFVCLMNHQVKVPRNLNVQIMSRWCSFPMFLKSVFLSPIPIKCPQPQPRIFVP